MTAEELIDIFQWSDILYATKAHHDAARRRFDAMILRRLRLEIGP